MSTLGLFRTQQQQNLPQNRKKPRVGPGSSGGRTRWPGFLNREYFHEAN